MQNRIGATGHPLHPHLSISRVEQGQQLGRAIADILVRLPLGLSGWLPTVAQVGLGLKRTGLIGGPDR